MADSVASLLPRLRPLLPDLLETEVELRRDGDGVLHALSSPWRCSPTSDPVERVKVTQMRPSKTCPTCLRTYRLGDALPEGLLLTRVVELLHQEGRSRKLVSGSPSSRALTNQRTLHSTAHSHLEKAASSSTALSAGDSARLTALLDSSSAVLRSLTRALRDPGEVASTLLAMREAVLEELGLPSDSLLDERTTLLGMPTPPPGSLPQHVQTLLEQSSLRESPLLVAALPRWAVDRLLLRLEPVRAATLHPSADAGGLDAPGLETAAMLWDPAGTGPSATLSGCVAMARAL